MYWLVPSVTSNQFIGQTELMEKLQHQLLPSTEEHRQAKQRRFILVGSAGSGKSEVCLRFAEMSRNKFRGVFWIDASFEESAKLSFIEIAKHCNVGEKSIEGVKSWLSSVSWPWLLILDNADDAGMDYSRYFPSGNTGSVLLATRCRSHDSLNTVGWERMAGLDEAHAVKLLLEASGVERGAWSAKQEAAEKVIKDLGTNPLAIVQAGACIGGGYCTLEQFPEKHSRCRQELKESDTAQKIPLNDNAYTTFELSVKMLEASKKQEAVYALDVLRIAALLHSEDIAETIFEQASMYSHKLKPMSHESTRKLHLSEWHVSRLRSLSFIDRESSSPEPDRVRFSQARDLLISTRLVKFDARKCAISVQRAVHEWLRFRMDKTIYWETWFNVGSILALATQEIRMNHGFSRHLPHVEAYLGRDRIDWSASSDIIQVIRTFYCLVWILKGLHALQTAISLARETLEAASRDCFKSDPTNLMILKYLYADCLHESGDHETAIPLLKEVVDKGRADLPATHPDLLQSEKTLASCYRSKGMFEGLFKFMRAEKPQDATQKTEVASNETPIDRLARLLEEAIRNPKPLALPGQLGRPEAQFELARLHSTQKSFDKSTKLLEDVKTQFDKLPPHHTTRLTTQHELGRVYSNTGRFDEALTALKEVVKTEKTLPTLSLSDRLNSEHELGRAYNGAGQYKNAAKMLENVVKHDKETLLPTDPDRLASELELAKSYRGQGQTRKSIGLLKEVVAGYKTSPQTDDESHVLALQELARAYIDDGKHGDARSVLQEVQTIQKRMTCPQDDPVLQQTRILKKKCQRSGETGKRKT